MLRLPVLAGIIDRRMLVNFRVCTDALRPLVPAPLRVETFEGFGMAGICLIRLKNIRPRRWPPALGVRSENAAHRIAVEWNDAETGALRRGVYIPRRDSSSFINALAGGRAFPGVHHRARFKVAETDHHLHIVMQGDGASVSVDADVAQELPSGSVFGTLARASDFFRGGSLGLSPSRSGDLDGIELCTETWKVEPLAVRSVRSSFFENATVFPQGSVQFDCALLMRNVEHEWHGREPISCGTTATTARAAG